MIAAPMKPDEVHRFQQFTVRAPWVSAIPEGGFNRGPYLAVRAAVRRPILVLVADAVVSQVAR